MYTRLKGKEEGQCGAKEAGVVVVHRRQRELVFGKFRFHMAVPVNKQC